MEICQHCGMYMKPFIGEKKVTCEFCGKTIAIKDEESGKWVRIENKSFEH
jgi:hypothetical protein